MDLNAADSATFIEKLDRGDFDNDAAQIRKRLQDNSDFFGFFDLRNIETAHQEGAALVTEGVNFYGKAIKQVLDKVFPASPRAGITWKSSRKNLQRLTSSSRAEAPSPTTFVSTASRSPTLRPPRSPPRSMPAPATWPATRTHRAHSTPPASVLPSAVSMSRTANASSDDRVAVRQPQGRDAVAALQNTGPASADASTQSLSDAAGIATFTFDAGYAPKNGTYAIDCSLDDYITRTASFTYGAAAAAEPNATPTVAPDEAAPAATPMPQPTVCSTVVPHSGPTTSTT